ncbi:MAG TPA: hypothetical protein VGD69_23925 [Herpetosiphonaceae bacterium]
MTSGTLLLPTRSLIRKPIGKRIDAKQCKRLPDTQRWIALIEQ